MAACPQHGYLHCLVGLSLVVFCLYSVQELALDRLKGDILRISQMFSKYFLTFKVQKLILSIKCRMKI
jgi:hypothetical protein